MNGFTRFEITRIGPPGPVFAGAEPVVKDQVKSLTKALPLKSLTPLDPLLMVAL